MRAFLTCLFVLITLASPRADDAFFEVDALNVGLPAAQEDLDLTTPQSAMEAFLFAIEDEKYEVAAHVLDLSALDIAEQAVDGPDLARKLASVMDRKVVLSWQKLLERPDSLDANASSKDVMAGQSRKSLLIGILDLKNRAVAIRLNRLKPKNEAAVWVFSKQTVANIPELYETYGPSKFEKALPEWLKRDAFWGMKWWEVVGLPLLFFGTLVIVRVLWKSLGGIAHWQGHSTFSRVIRGLRLPLTLAVAALVVQMATAYLFVVSGFLSNILQPMILLTFVVAIISLIVNVIDAFLDSIISGDFDTMSAADAEDRRALATTVGAVRRMTIIVAVLFTAGIVLSSSSTFQSMGFSLIASAGALTLLLGFAARAVLGNILASMQISLNRSARIGDQLVFQGELCRVERIHFTFIQLRHWTGTRMIVPVSEFVSDTFYNRSIVDQAMTRALKMKLSPLVDLDELRTAYKSIVENDDEVGPKEEAVMLVTGQDALGIDVRFDLPCPDPTTAWDAECRVREKLIGVLNEQSTSDGKPIYPNNVAEVA